MLPGILFYPEVFIFFELLKFNFLLKQKWLCGSISILRELQNRSRKTRNGKKISVTEGRKNSNADIFLVKLLKMKSKFSVLFFIFNPASEFLKLFNFFLWQREYRFRGSSLRQNAPSPQLLGLPSCSLRCAVSQRLAVHDLKPGNFPAGSVWQSDALKDVLPHLNALSE